MGASYANLAVRADADRVQEVLGQTGLSALVGPTRDGWTGVFPDDADVGLVDVAASLLSRELSTVALTTVVHDDRVLLATLVDDGERVDDYASGFGDFDPEMTGGNFDVGRVVETVGPASDAADLATCLDGGFESQTARHGELLRVLGLPGYLAGTGFGRLQRGELPDGLTRDQLREVKLA